MGQGTQYTRRRGLHEAVSFFSPPLYDSAAPSLFFPFMAQNSHDVALSSDYELIFASALQAYKEKTGKDLASDPLLRRLETCNTPDSVLALLRQQISGFDGSGNSDVRLTNWVNPAVNVLCTFAATIGGAVSLVSPGKFEQDRRSNVFF